MMTSSPAAVIEEDKESVDQRKEIEVEPPKMAAATKSFLSTFKF